MCLYYSHSSSSSCFLELLYLRKKLSRAKNKKPGLLKRSVVQQGKTFQHDTKKLCYVALGVILSY